MKNNFFKLLNNYIREYPKLVKTKIFLYIAIKNYYLSIRTHKAIKLYTPDHNIKLLYSKMYFLNLLENKTIDKWFIFKLIKN